MRKRLDAELLHEHFSRSSQFQVDLSTTNLNELEHYFTKNTVMLAILDSNYPGRMAFDIGCRGREAGSAQHLVMVDEYYNPRRAKLAESMRAAYCTKNSGLQQLSYCTDLLANNPQIEPNQVSGLIDVDYQSSVDFLGSVRLTPREIEVWTLLAEGNTVKDCAEELGLSIHTAENHKWRLMKKLNVHRTTLLVHLAIRHGLVEV